jgi:membrane protease YdiL (CAAX protease family)
MFQYYTTLCIYSIAAFFIICVSSIKNISENIGIIINIIIWYTILNFANVFPWFGFGSMNWTGKLLVLFIIVILLIYKKIRNERGFISFLFNEKNRTIILTTIIIYLITVFLVFGLLTGHKKLNIERFLMNIILVGISEELYFHGLIFSKLLKLNKGRKNISIVTCSVMFGIVHMYFFSLSLSQNIINFILSFLLALLMIILYEKSKNILVPILAHNSIDTAYYGTYVILEVYFFKLGGGT